MPRLIFLSEDLDSHAQTPVAADTGYEPNGGPLRTDGLVSSVRVGSWFFDEEFRVVLRLTFRSATR